MPESPPALPPPPPPRPTLAQRLRAGADITARLLTAIASAIAIWKAMH
ncbi:hypothetical protein [Paracraurococcus ruber]|nr:hypothetical protein [Paracraurococcus ruber]